MEWKKNTWYFMQYKVYAICNVYIYLSSIITWGREISNDSRIEWPAHSLRLNKGKTINSIGYTRRNGSKGSYWDNMTTGIYRRMKYMKLIVSPDQVSRPKVTLFRDKTIPNLSRSMCIFKEIMLVMGNFRWCTVKKF